MSSRLDRLQGKVVVVTGAGSGMGREVALLAARHGARVAVSDVNEQGLAETVDLLKDAGAPEVRSDRVDVAARQEVIDWAAAVAEQFGTVNQIYNNAGIAFTGDVEISQFKDIERVMDVDFWGVVNGTKAFLPHLIASGDGHLVNISSLFGLISIPGQSAYNATKFAVRGFTEAVREEMIVNRHPVKVTCVHPGGIKTGIARNGRKVAGTNVQATDDFFDQKLAKMTADKAARIILEGAMAGKPRQLVGLDAHALHQFGRITGARYQDVVARVAGRMNPGKKIV